MIVWIIVGAAVVLLALIVIAPWRRVRAEQPLDPVVETRLLSGEDPHAIAADLDAAPVPEVDPPELRTGEMTALRAIAEDTDPLPYPEA